MELKEGDTLRVGGSTRVYRLHWIPLVRAYDIENPFVPEMDLSTEKLGEEENPVVVPEIATETNQVSFFFFVLFSRRNLRMATRLCKSVKRELKYYYVD